MLVKLYEDSLVDYCSLVQVKIELVNGPPHRVGVVEDTTIRGECRAVRAQVTMINRSPTEVLPNVVERSHRLRAVAIQRAGPQTTAWIDLAIVELAVR